MPPAIPNLVPRPQWGLESVIDPAYAKLGELLSAPEELPAGGFAFFGIPFEGLTFYSPAGGKGGPDGLRAALARLRPYSIDLDVDFVESNGMADIGDVEVEQMSYDVTLSRAEAVMRATLERGWTPVVAGGSHTITEATFRAFSEHHGKRVGLIWIDGHLDLMDNYKGDRHYCGCPLRRSLESHVRPENVAHLGMRGFANAAPELREWRERGVSFYTQEMMHAKGLDRCVDEAIEIATRDTDAFYLTFDTDSLDHTFAPGTQWPGPGGLQAFEAMRLVRRIALAGAGAMDIVEYAPVLDPQRNTGNLLATLMAEFMAGTARRQLDAATGEQVERKANVR